MTKTAYLTIDDAPSTDFLNKLDFLEQRGIKAVWFCQGNYLERRPDAILEAIRAGHIIANHTYTHPHCSELTLDQVFAEIRACDAVLDELYQRAGLPRRQRYFRFPYGDKGDGRHGDNFRAQDSAGGERHAAVQGYLRILGYTQPRFPDVTYRHFREAGLLADVDWYWTYDTLDWSVFFETPMHGIDSPQKVLARTLEDVLEGGRGLSYPDSADIILIHDHDTHPDAPQLFRDLVTRFLEMGLDFRLP